ncbi:DinB family protein [Hymenobacter cellulosivorans]|uniref:DinB family protein n=1 Tax=Hymenobacter cellulosivorans TaxID=2932249 RepID=A0ABY4F791_9BACT|nr:DinB family protein [Hymenobacter cellulosivorans]UOQ52324.1 DinB family protein [Hymenobacter cellulosivorans]
METTLAASPLAQAFSIELLDEAKLTRRVLERVPVAQFDWQPHVKSMKLGQLARHTADLIGWIKDTLDTTEIDVAVFDDAPVMPITSTEELLAYFNQRVEAANTGLLQATPEDLEQQWTMRSGDYVIVAQPRAEVVRHLISHMIHHRGQLSVYLRLLDVPVPYIYGPSADDSAQPE